MMNRKTLIAAFLLVAPLLAWACPCPAAGPEEAPPPGPPPPGVRGGEMSEALQMVHLQRLRQALDLTDQQTLALMKLMDERRESEKELRLRHREAMENLRRLVKEGATDREYLGALEALETAEREARRQQEELKEREDAILSPRQRAMRRLFEPRFREQMEQRIREFRGAQRGPGPGPGAGQRLERLRETDPELYERLQRRMQERRSREGSGGS